MTAWRLNEVQGPWPGRRAVRSNQLHHGVRCELGQGQGVRFSTFCFRTKQVSLKQDSMQGWKQQNDWRQPQSERGHDWRKNKTGGWASRELWTPKNRRPASDGFRDTRSFVTEHAAWVKSTSRSSARWDSDEPSSDKVTIACVAEGYDPEAREQGVRGIWDEGGDEEIFVSTLSRLRRESDRSSLVSISTRRSSRSRSYRK